VIMAKARASSLPAVRTPRSVGVANIAADCGWLIVHTGPLSEQWQ